eukprot:scaffold11258_cov67-Cylindrotheca_fusiformis.AAC.1
MMTPPHHATWALPPYKKVVVFRSIVTSGEFGSTKQQEPQYRRHCSCWLLATLQCPRGLGDSPCETCQEQQNDKSVTFPGLKATWRNQELKEEKSRYLARRRIKEGEHWPPNEL